jgi:hypothetical protein
VAALFSILFLGAAERAMAQAANRAESLAAWTQIQAVLQHPRCLNCHQLDAPLQGDARRPHIPLVVRGPENQGVSAMKCANCHNAMGNNPTSRTPGAPHWQLAPVSMLWQGLSGGALCRSVKDPQKNGKRSLEDIVTHMGTDKLVLWGWDPGAGREAVSLGHDEFMKQVHVWVAGGAACPQ